MTNDEFKRLSEDLKMDICREIAYEYAVFVPKDEPRAISKFKSIVYLSDKRFLENDVLEKADGGQIFPYNVIMAKVEKMVNAYYQEFKLGINAQSALADYGERGEKFKTHFEKCIAESQENTIKYIKQELFRQLLRGNEVKATIKRVGETITRRTNSLNRLIESLSGQMEQFMVLCNYQDKGYTKYRINAMGENCEDCQSIHGKIFNIEDCEIGENLPPFHPNCDCSIEIIDEDKNIVYANTKAEQDEQNWGKYLQASIKQLVLGNYTDDVNLFGTALQVLAGVIGVDLPADVRDLFYDVTNFKLTKEHIAQTILDAAALLPVVGGVKYVDEAGAVVKSGAKYGDEVADTAKAVNKAAKFVGYPKNIHPGRQGKHIVGHNNYQTGKSIFTKTIEEAQNLIDKYSGTGRKVGQNREIVDFENIIGKYVDPQTGKAYDTTIGTIHYSKDGTHIVPERPINWRK